MMTLQHFEALAEAIRFSDLDPTNRAKAADAVADACLKFNPRFDRAKFTRAALEPRSDDNADDPEPTSPLYRDPDGHSRVDHHSSTD